MLELPTITRLEIALLYNLMQSKKPDGWKSRKEIVTTIDELAKRGLPESLQFTCPTKSNTTNIFNKLIARGLVETKKEAYIDKKNRKLHRKVWRIKTDTITRKTISNQIINFDVKRNTGEKISPYFNLKQDFGLYDDKIYIKLLKKEYEQGLERLCWNIKQLKRAGVRVNIQKDLNKTLKRPNSLIESILLSKEI